MALYEVVMSDAGDWSHGKNYVEAKSVGDAVDAMQAWARKFDRTGRLHTSEELELLGDDPWFADHQFASITVVDELPVIRRLKNERLREALERIRKIPDQGSVGLVLARTEAREALEEANPDGHED